MSGSWVVSKVQWTFLAGSSTADMYVPLFTFSWCLFTQCYVQQQCKWRAATLGCVAGKWKHATIWIQPYELPLSPHSPLPSSCLVNPFLCKFHIGLKSFHAADTLCSTFVSPPAPALELLRCIVTRKCSRKKQHFFEAEGCICICMPRPASYLATACTR